MPNFITNKILFIGGGIVFLLVGIIIGSGLGGNESTQIDLSTVSIPVSNVAVKEVDIQNNVGGGLVKVVRVIDGDTIEIEGGEHIRYIGMDTPETVDPRKPVQCFGVEASKKNKELVEGKMVHLEKDITDRDKYNRLLRYVWVGDTFINIELVKQGFASSYSYPPDVKYQDQFVEAQKESREANRGLWKACQTDSQTISNLPKESSVTPSAPNPTSPTAPVLVVPAPTKTDSCVIKGNISSSGEKIYHIPGCGSYSQTKIDESHGEHWFCTESEAQSAGWRKALNCP